MKIICFGGGKKFPSIKKKTCSSSSCSSTNPGASTHGPFKTQRIQTFCTATLNNTAKIDVAPQCYMWMSV